MTSRSNHCRRSLAGFVVCILALPPVAHAIDAIELEVREMTVAGIPVTGTRVRLDLVSDQQTRLRMSAAQMTLPDPVGTISRLDLLCERPVIVEPDFGCAAGRFSARGGPTGAIDAQIVAGLRSDTGVTTFSARGMKIAGTTANLDARLDGTGWRVKGSTARAKFSALRKFAAPWFELPPDITGDGDVQLEGTAADAGKGLTAEVTASLSALDLTNEASTVVTDKLAAVAHLRAEARGDTTLLDVRLEGGGGQALAGPVYYDFNANPLLLEARGRLGTKQFILDSMHLRQVKLLDMHGNGRIDLTGEMPSLTGEFTLDKVEFPAAFTAYAANFLATSMIGDAKTRGSLTGVVSIVDNGVHALHVMPADLDFSANQGSLHLEGMHGEIFWSPAGAGDARISKLAWNSGGAYGLSGGSSGIEFIAYGANFALTRPAKLPVFDGAITIDHLAMGNLGAPDMEVAFKGAVQPISMPLLAKAFGWPQFSGSLAASIPGVRLKDNVLTFDGNVESEVFGGRITGSNIRLQDPLGNHPQFFADVRARDLDLGLVTQTFEVGSITGKLEADVLGLELFDWTPQAFDARLATPKGDKSRHRISAKAVSTLSNVGGGGGGVVQALQSGVLKFFDEYSYDKIGIRCRLVGAVCEMSGVEPAPNGYYIVKGAGIPRIDIVGNQGRVNWDQLMSSIATANFSGATTQ
ncbi:MAG TPA: hypothetical protein VFL16_10645 [Steroidobacteraceae bacterium]|nr:hypothetical protein [Steroidobacteraceae bacterium]